jgi:hypothetical protein
MFNLNIKGMTEGEFMSLVRALRFYDSIVSRDVLCSIAYAGDTSIQERVESYIKDVELSIQKEIQRKSNSDIPTPA